MALRREELSPDQLTVLHAQLDELAADKDYRRHVADLIEEHREILDRLADA